MEIEAIKKGIKKEIKVTIATTILLDIKTFF